MTLPEELDQPALRFHLDISSGDVYQQDDEGLWYFQGTIPGTGGGFPGNGAAPPTVTGLVVDPASAEQPDGTFVPALVATWDPVVAPDVTGYTVEWQLVDEFDPPSGPGDFPNPQTVSVAGTIAGLYPVVAGAWYDVHVRAYDVETFHSVAWSTVVREQVLGDDTAPAVPEDVAVLPGYLALGVRWSRGSEPDLDHFDVRWTPDVAGAPDPLSWSMLSTASDFIVISGLLLKATYWVQVRAVDRSDNVVTSAVDPTPVPSLSNPDAGWSAEVSGTTTGVPPENLLIDEAMVTMLYAGEIDADLITTGVLRIGKTAVAGATKVFDSLGRMHGRWDDIGLLMVNPDDRHQAMWLKSGSLLFTAQFPDEDVPSRPVDAEDDWYWDTAAGDESIWTTAVTPYGINVSALTFGSINTGSNLVPNAGCELAAFASVADSSKEWTLTTDWDDATATAINLNMSTGDLKMTTV